MITDTTKTPHPEWLFGGNPSAIELQGAHGQQELVNSCELPRELNIGGGAYNIYDTMGIVVLGDRTDQEQLFIEVRLPEGWRIIPTDHVMWSELVDEGNRKRASIFYKAAFYARDAYISFNQRFTYHVITYSKEVDEKYVEFYKVKNHTPCFGRVCDAGKVVFETPVKYFDKVYVKDESREGRAAQVKWWDEWEKFENSIHTLCTDWLNTNYPHWNNIFEYWGEPAEHK